NATQPCPICAVSVGGAACAGSPGSPCAGVCDGGANQGGACQSTNGNGLSNDCPAPTAVMFTNRCYRWSNNEGVCTRSAECPSGVCSQFGGDLTLLSSPLTTGTASLSNANGLFCPGQTTNQKGAFKSDISPDRHE